MRKLSSDEAALMLKLYRRRKFGASHILEDNLLEGFPTDKVDLLRNALKTLKKDGILRAKKTKHGDAVSIPPTLGKEVYGELRKRYPWLPEPPWL